MFSQNAKDFQTLSNYHIPKPLIDMRIVHCKHWTIFRSLEPTGTEKLFSTSSHRAAHLVELPKKIVMKACRDFENDPGHQSFRLESLNRCKAGKIDMLQFLQNGEKKLKSPFGSKLETDTR